MSKSDTKKLLLELYGPTMNAAELAQCFKYRNKKGVLNAIGRGDFPVPTFKLGARRVASTSVVADYIDRQSEEYDVPVKAYPFKL